MSFSKRLILKVEAMKKIMLILLLVFFTESIQAQLFKTLKAKTKDAVNNSIDRSTNKLIDKTINNPVDNATDTVLTKSERKVDSIFKKRKGKNGEVVDSTTVPPADTALSKQGGPDSRSAVVLKLHFTTGNADDQSSCYRASQYAVFIKSSITIKI